MSENEGPKDDFAAQAAEQQRTSLVGEFVEFLSENYAGGTP